MLTGGSELIAEKVQTLLSPVVEAAVKNRRKNAGTGE
jgi:hypothetical protein